MRIWRFSWGDFRVGMAMGLLAAGATLAGAAEGPPPAREPNRQELQQEIQRLQDTVRDLQSEVDQVRRTIPPQASGLVTVPMGARQAAPFNAPAPEFGPSEWIPTWPPVRNPSPQARERLPRERGATLPPVDEPLDYPQFIPGTLVVQHGLGQRPVNVTIAVVNPDGTVNMQVDSNRIVVTASSPPNGTFTLANYYEQPVTVRWTAQVPRPTQ